MVYKVLVVDDSHFFQHRLKAIINQHPDLEVVGIAANGNEAIAMAAELRPDVISMDYEMPYLDGVSAVRAIMARHPVPIVMFSSLTYEGARVTLDALAAGAVDFIPKNLAEMCRDSSSLTRTLHETLLTFARKGQAAKRQIATPQVTPDAPAEPRPPAPGSFRGRVNLIVIGASTGGPVALTEVLQLLPASLPVPVVVVQHMPEGFTRVLAERLDRQCSLSVTEAIDGQMLRPGGVVIAPGGQQLLLHRHGSLRILPGDERVNYKPCVDLTFASAANIYGSAVLAVVLTGMGADGCEGARLLREKNAVIWAQDEASSMVYGMPRAVTRAGLTDAVLPLRQIGHHIRQAF